MLTKPGKLTTVLLAVFISIGSDVTASQWRSLNNMHDVYDIVFSEGGIWCATGGGFVGFSPDEKSFETYTYIEGIAGTKLNRLAVDDAGGIWMVIENHNMQRFDPEGKRITHSVFSNEINAINDIAIDTRGIYLATNMGVGRLKYFPDPDDWHWFERFTRLDSSSDFPDNIPATSVVIQADTGTHFGYDGKRDIFDTPLAEWTEEDLEENFANFTAIKIPKKFHKWLYPSISHVNMFRLIFSVIENKAPSFIPDYSYSTHYDKGDEFGKVHKYER